MSIKSNSNSEFNKPKSYRDYLDSVNDKGSLREACSRGGRIRDQIGDRYVREIHERIGNNWDIFLINLNPKNKKTILNTLKNKEVNIFDLLELRNKAHKFNYKQIQDENNEKSIIAEKVVNFFHKIQRIFYFGLKIGLKPDELTTALIFEQIRIKSDQSQVEKIDFDDMKEQSRKPGGVHIHAAPNTDILKCSTDFKVVAGSHDLHSNPGGVAGAFDQALHQTEDKKGWRAFQMAIREFVSRKIDDPTTKWIDQKQSLFHKLFGLERTPKQEFRETITHLSHLDDTKPNQKLIWAVGPRYPENPSKENIAKTDLQLKVCYKTILETVLHEAKNSNSKKVTVAIPLMSAGIFKCPPEKSIQIACDAIREFNETKHTDIVINVFICAKEGKESSFLNGLEQEIRNKKENNEKMLRVNDKSTFEEESDLIVTDSSSKRNKSTLLNSSNSGNSTQEDEVDRLNPQREDEINHFNPPRQKNWTSDDIPSRAKSYSYVDPDSQALVDKLMTRTKKREDKNPSNENGQTTSYAYVAPEKKAAQDYAANFMADKMKNSHSVAKAKKEEKILDLKKITEMLENITQDPLTQDEFDYLFIKNKYTVDTEFNKILAALLEFRSKPKDKPKLSSLTVEDSGGQVDLRKKNHKPRLEKFSNPQLTEFNEFSKQRLKEYLESQAGGKVSQREFDHVVNNYTNYNYDHAGALRELFKFRAALLRK
jgi:hypothetical protein